MGNGWRAATDIGDIITYMPVQGASCLGPGRPGIKGWAEDPD